MVRSRGTLLLVVPYLIVRLRSWPSAAFLSAMLSTLILGTRQIVFVFVFFGHSAELIQSSVSRSRGAARDPAMPI